jgi:hypothetical protein
LDTKKKHPFSKEPNTLSSKNRTYSWFIKEAFKQNIDKGKMTISELTEFLRSKYPHFEAMEAKSLRVALRQALKRGKDFLKLTDEKIVRYALSPSLDLET